MLEIFSILKNSSLGNISDPFSFILETFLLLLCRLIPIILQAPFWGAKIAPAPPRMGLALAFAILIYPKTLVLTTQSVGLGWAFAGYALKELMIGTVIGFLIIIPFQIAAAAGTLIDHQRGASSLITQDPTLKNQVSSIGIMYNYVTIVVFFSINGPFLFIDGLLYSYEVLPPDQMLSAFFFQFSDGPFWKTTINLAQKILDVSMRLSAPALIMLFISDVFLGIANRLAPQVQITFLGFSLKSLYALFIMVFGWSLTVRVMGEIQIDWLAQLKVMYKTFSMHR